MSKAHWMRQWHVVLFGALAAMIWSLFLAFPHMRGDATALDALEAQTLDLRHRLVGTRAASANVVIVAIDDATLAMEDEGFGDPRQRLARLVEEIASQGARALAIDILLADKAEVDSDAALADALSGIPTAIAAALIFPAEASGADVAQAEHTLLPQPDFSARARVGIVNLSTDRSGTPRYMPLLFVLGGELQPALSLAAVLAFADETASFEADYLSLGDHRIPLDGGFNMALRYLGPEGTVPTLSARTLLEGDTSGLLKDKLVVLGFTASATGDRFATPYGDAIPGVEIIATGISQLMGGPSLRRDTALRRIDAAHALGLAAVVTALILAVPLVNSIPAVAVLLALSLTATVVAFAAGIWLSAALPIVAVLPPLGLAGLLRYTQERRFAQQSARAVQTLRQFQAPELADRLQRDPEYLRAPVDQTLVIFFVDLTGFTALSRRLGARGTQEMLKEFHAMVAETVEARSGSVFNFMGDGVLAVFGLEPDQLVAAPDQALAAAFALSERIAEYHPQTAPDAPMGCRIGLHLGPATLSRLGAATHLQVTVTGDSVNLASRLMEVAKSEGAGVVASADFFDALTAEPAAPLSHRSDVDIRGLEGKVSVVCWRLHSNARQMPEH